MTTETLTLTLNSLAPLFPAGFTANAPVDGDAPLLLDLSPKQPSLGYDDEEDDGYDDEEDDDDEDGDDEEDDDYSYDDEDEDYDDEEDEDEDDEDEDEDDEDEEDEDTGYYTCPWVAPE